MTRRNINIPAVAILLLATAKNHVLAQNTVSGNLFGYGLDDCTAGTTAPIEWTFNFNLKTATPTNAAVQECTKLTAASGSVGPNYEKFIQAVGLTVDTGCTVTLWSSQGLDGNSKLTDANPGTCTTAVGSFSGAIRTKNGNQNGACYALPAEVEAGGDGVAGAPDLSVFDLSPVNMTTFWGLQPMVDGVSATCGGNS